MNKEILKHTTKYEDELIEDLRDSEEAQAYLEEALKVYDEDGDIQALLLAMRDVAEAQGGVGQLAKRMHISRQNLYDVLAHKPRLDNLLDILSGLGFRIRLERKEVTTERAPVAMR